MVRNTKAYFRLDRWQNHNDSGGRTIENAINEGHINPDELDYRLPNEESERSNESFGKNEPPTAGHQGR